MKKYFFLFMTITIFFSACNDPIFYNISLEEKILEPRIKGSPTNFVEFKDNMYVASGKYIYKYKNGQWSELSGTDGNIFSLAVTNDYIYALCVEAEKSKLKRSEDGIVWKEVTISPEHNILVIYSAGDQLFIGAGYPSGDKSYYILNGNDLSTILAETGNSLLNGAAYYGTNYYLCVKDLGEETGGIYIINNLSVYDENSTRLIKSSIPFMGIMNTRIGSNPIVAVSRNGDLYTVNANSVDKIASLGNNYNATGALAVWTDGTNYLLLVGRKDTNKSTVNSGYTYGYLEMEITSGVLAGSLSEPGIRSITTLNPDDDNGRYKSTIGKIPVNFIYQAPQYIDSGRTLFASTQKNGLWSYRDRRGMWHWNAEE